MNDVEHFGGGSWEESGYSKFRIFKTQNNELQLRFVCSLKVDSYICHDNFEQHTDRHIFIAEMGSGASPK